MYINILLVGIVLYQQYDVDIIYLNNVKCWYCFISTTYFLIVKDINEDNLFDYD